MVIDDEAYYAMYARHLSPGYIDHGPTVAFVIWLFTLIFGETGFGIRFGSVFLLTLMGWILYQFGKNQFSERAGIILSLLVVSNVLFHTNGVIITPDAPLAFFTICAMMLYFKGYHENAKPAIFCIIKGKKKSGSDAMQFFSLMTAIPLLYFLEIYT